MAQTRLRYGCSSSTTSRLMWIDAGWAFVWRRILSSDAELGARMKVHVHAPQNPKLLVLNLWESGRLRSSFGWNR